MCPTKLIALSSFPQTLQMEALVWMLVPSAFLPFEIIFWLFSIIDLTFSSSARKTSLIGNVPETFCNFLGTFGNVSETFGNLLETFGNVSETFGNLLGTFGNVIGIFSNISETFGNALGTFSN